MRNFWSIAQRNLLRNKRRNVATGAATALGFAALIIVGGYYNWIGNMLRVFTVYGSRTGHIAIYQTSGLERSLIKPRKFSLDATDLALIEEVTAALENVEMAGAKLRGTGLIGNGCRSFPYRADGIDPELEKLLRHHPQAIKWLGDLRFYKKGRSIADYPPDIGAIILGEGLARFLGKSKVHDEIDQGLPVSFVINCDHPDVTSQIRSDANVQLAAGSYSGMMSSIDAEIVATQKEGQIEANNTAILAPINHLRQLYDTDSATSYSIWLTKPSKIDKTIIELKSKFAARGKRFDIYRWDDKRLSPYYTGSKQFIDILVTFISSIVLFVIAFSIFNSVTITLIERAQEVGMMRALGFTRNHMRMLYVMEILLLSILAIFIGSICAGLGAFIVNLSNIPYNPPGVVVQLWLRLVPSLEIFLASTFIIFFLTTSVTLFAVWSISKRNVAQLLVEIKR